MGFFCDNIGISVWIDGSSVAKMPVLMACWKFVLSDEIVSAIDSYDDGEAILKTLRKTNTFVLIPANETRK